MMLLNQKLMVLLILNFVMLEAKVKIFGLQVVSQKVKEDIVARKKFHVKTSISSTTNVVVTTIGGQMNKFELYRLDNADVPNEDIYGALLLGGINNPYSTIEVTVLPTNQSENLEFEVIHSWKHLPVKENTY